MGSDLRRRHRPAHLAEEQDSERNRASRRVRIRRVGRDPLNLKRIIRNVFFVLSVGLAIHLILPQIPGITHSAQLISTSSPFLVSLAFLCEVLSFLSYGELMGRTSSLAVRRSASAASRRHAGFGPFFTFRLTVVGNGAARVLPGGGAASAAISYGGLKSRGLEARQIGGVVATVATLVYAALAAISLFSLSYLLLANELDGLQSFLAGFALAVAVVLVLTALAAYRFPNTTKRTVAKLTNPIMHYLDRLMPKRNVRARLDGYLVEVRDGIRGAVRQMRGHAFEEVRLITLGFGYWAFDFACLVVMFEAFGVEVNILHLLVAYGIATAAGNLPITPGGIGVFETTMFATLALLGVGSEAIIPVLGYRIFNFWLPIPAAAALYPTIGFHKEHELPKRRIR